MHALAHLILTCPHLLHHAAAFAPAAPTPTGSPAPAPHPPSAWKLGGFAVVTAVVLAVAYTISIRLHPFKRCRRCGGTGKHRGWIFRSSFRACDRCGGTGRQYRWRASAPYKQNPDKRRGQEQ